MREEELAELLWQALDTKNGIEIDVVKGSPKLLRERLYRLIREHEHFSGLQLSEPQANGTQFYIIRKENNDGKET